MAIGTCILIILGLYFAGLIGGQQDKEQRYDSENRWGRRKQHQKLKNSQVFLIVSMIIAISCMSGTLVLIRTPQPVSPTATQLQSTPIASTIPNAKADVFQNQIVNSILEDINVVVHPSALQNKVQVAPGPLMLLTIFGNLFVISIIANIMGRKNPNFRKTKRAATLVIWCLFFGILFEVNRQRNVTVWMKPGRNVTTVSAKPGWFENNGINPIPEEIQTKLRADLKQAAASGTDSKSNKAKKLAKILPGSGVEEYKLQSAPCATKEKAKAEVEDKLRLVIAERLKQYNLTDENSIESIVTSLNPKTVIAESIKEVAGEKYPIYTGTIEIALGQDFDQNMVRHFNSLSARNRYEWLMAGSVIAVIALALYDQVVLANAAHASPKPPGETQLA